MKQASLFNFDSEPEDKQPAAAAIIKEDAVIINEEPVEINFAVEISETPVAVSTNSKGKRKLNKAGLNADLIDIPEDEILFQKKYYAIGVVAEMFKVNISLLRFWEKEFDILKPKKNGKGDRHFRPEDVKNLKLIHHLLKEKRYTLEGAKDFLKNNKKADENFALIEDLKKIKLFLYDLKMSL